MFELGAEFAADLVEDDSSAHANGVAGKANGIGFTNDDSFFRRVKGFDPMELEIVEGVWKVHDVAAFKRSEAGVEVVKARIDEVKRRDRDVPCLAEHAMARCCRAETVTSPEAAAID